jgi:hypothetical protein
VIDKNFLTRVYRHFSDFASEAAARELEYFVLDSKYTTAFNVRMQQLVESIRKEGKKDIEFSVIFNTEGHIAVVDSDVIGRFIGNNYNISIERLYKTSSLNKIVTLVVNGTEKNKRDFVKVSYKIIQDTLKIIYSEIIYRKDIELKYREMYSLQSYNGEDIAVIVVSLMILEDICQYLNIQDEYLKACVMDSLKKNFN